MGEKFSWDKILNRKNGQETAEETPGQGRPVAQLNNTENISASQVTPPPVITETVAAPVEPQADSGSEAVSAEVPSNGPVRVQWDMYAPIPDDIPSTTPQNSVAPATPPAPVQQDPVPYQPNPVDYQSDTSKMPGDLPDAAMNWLKGEESMGLTEPSPIPPISEWEDVELVQPEPQVQSYQVFEPEQVVEEVSSSVEEPVEESVDLSGTAFGEAELLNSISDDRIDTGASFDFSPSAEVKGEPEVKSEEVVAQEIAPAPWAAQAKLNKQVFEFDADGRPVEVAASDEPSFEEPAPAFEPSAVSEPEPVSFNAEDEAEAVTAPSDGIPDIFKKAMGMAIDEPKVEATYTSPSDTSDATVNELVEEICADEAPVEPVGESAPVMEVEPTPAFSIAEPAVEAVAEVEEPDLAAEATALTVEAYEEPAVEVSAEIVEEPVAEMPAPVEEPLVSVSAAESVTEVAEREELPEEYLKSDDSFESMRVRDRRLGDLLLENKLITKRQLDRALERQRETKERIGAILIDMQTISERRLVQVLAMQKEVLPWHLEEDVPTEEALKTVPEDLCRAYQVLPVAVEGNTLTLAMDDAADGEAIASIKQHTGMDIRPVQAHESRLAYCIDAFYDSVKTETASHRDTELTQAIEAVTEFEQLNGGYFEITTPEATETVASFVETIINEAVEMKASDVHIEPRDGFAEVRYRLDGQLMKMREIPNELVPYVTARVKVLAGFELSEDRKAYDGKAEFTASSHPVGLRVSTLPNNFGTRIVLRVLDPTVGLRDVDGLGLESTNQGMFRDLISKPYGLFLVTGPTGSGKTTTLYAALDELRKTATNIMTCEDPVEYQIDGISQAEVDEKAGQTLAEQLRAVLRQDPDVVMVGEIRDAETAEVALSAAASGHMVFSTMHCNDAASAIPRLLDMGIEPSLLSSTLVGTMSQRLVRTLCPDCKQESAPTEDERQVLEGHFGLNGVEKVWHACGCDSCMQTGYKGRTAVHEVLPVVDDVASMIARRADVEKIRSEAAYYGYLPMQQDAIGRVLAGETTVEEARRVLKIGSIEKRAQPRQIELPKAS